MSNNPGRLPGHHPGQHPGRGAGFEAMQAFVQVVRSLGFTQAGRVTGQSVSTLSRLVRELEVEVGAQLLTRTTRRIHLTEAGALYLAHAESLIAGQRAAIDAVTELMGGVPRGTLRVSMPVAVGERLLGPRLPGFRAQYPELSLELDLADRNVPLVQGGFDLVVRVGRLADSSLRAQMLGRVPRRIVASPAFIAQHGAPQSPSDLARFQCITTRVVAGPVEWGFFRKRDGVPERVPVAGQIVTSSPALAVQLAVRGLGVLRTIEWVMREELRTGALVEVMEDYACDAPDVGGVPTWVVYAQGPGDSPPLKSRVFVGMVQEVIAEEVLANASGRRKPTARKPKRTDSSR